MTYKLTQSASIIRTSDGACIPADPANTDFIQYQKWLAAGNTPEPADAKTKEQIIEEYQAAVQKRLDDFAQTRNYNDILSACTYATSLVERFKIEGQYCVNARDTTWAKCYEILESVKTGKRKLPTLDQLMSELPILEWPKK